MLTVLFWNLKTPNAEVLAGLVRAHAVDVLVLAECPLLPGQVLRAINPPPSNEYFYAPADCPKLMLFTRFSDQFVQPVLKDGEPVLGDDFSIRRIVRPVTGGDFLLCAAHLPSKLYMTSEDQTAFATWFAEVLAGAEEAADNFRTVLVGDLNMNPYETGMVLSTGLHAVPTRTIATRMSRRVKFESNLYFYNPMWAHFGEKPNGHAGTYYYPSPRFRADFWNVYDQVLVRPELLPHFRDDEVRVLWEDAATGRPLTRAGGIPDAAGVSDHLPILFRLHV